MNALPKLVVVALLIALGALAWLLVAKLSEEAAFQIADIEPESSDGGLAATTSALLPENALPPISEFAAIVERPLFSQSRRPPAAEPPPQAAAPVRSTPTPPPVPQVPMIDARLQGVVRSDDGVVAILSIIGESELVRLRPGEAYRGWSLAEAGDDTFVLTAEDQEIRLRLNYRREGSAERN